MVSERVKKGLVFGIGAFLAVTGGLVGGFWPDIFDLVLSGQLILSPTSTSYDIWKDIPLPMYIDFYLFNWTNPEEVLNDPTVLPKVEEFGPYVFREYHVRSNLTWNDANNTVTYYQIRTWEYQPQLSNGSLDDEITNINVIATTTAYMSRSLPEIVRMFISSFINKSNATFVVTKTVRELLFDGYDDKLLDLALQLNTSFFEIPFKKFGYFAERNGSYTYDKAFNMFTGADSLSKLGMIYEWDYEHETPYYGSPCNVVHGSSGELWPPMGKEDTITIFAPDVCGGLELKYEGETEEQGISGLRYTGDERTLDNGTISPDKSCLSVGDEHPRGSLNVSACKFNAPLFMSFPHYYLADPVYLENVEGLNPSQSKHEFNFGIEPTSGIPLFVNARLQLSVMVKPYPDIELFERLNQTYFIPTLWFNQRVEINEEMADKVKLILVAEVAGLGIFFGLAGIGVLLILIGAIITIRRGWRGSEGGNLLLENQ